MADFSTHRRGALLGALATGVALALTACSEPEAPVKRPNGLAALGRGVEDVSLTDAGGRTIRWGALKGAPRAVFFGFTRCPEICPTTMSDLAAAIDRLGPAAAALKIDFVSVDPQRDTVELLGAYMGGFGPMFRGYTGDEAQVLRLANAYRAAYRRTPVEDGDYTMDHTTSVYLVDATGEVRDIVSYQSPPERVDAQLAAFLKL
jgi:protein SCO1